MLLGPVAQAQLETEESGHVLPKFIFHRIKDHLARPLNFTDENNQGQKNSAKLPVDCKQGWAENPNYSKSRSTQNHTKEFTKQK